MKENDQSMLEVIPREVPLNQLFGYLTGCVAPRPIAFASTVDADGRPNLSPFSFFNVFGANPPILVFSPSRRGRDNTTKDTYNNVKVVPEVVINMVNYDMVNQMSLASNEFPKGENEFIKAGFTPVKSDLVQPFRVKESPAQFECKVVQVIETGNDGGAGNLVICEVLKLHISKAILDEAGVIDPQKADWVARMGKDYYCRASGSSVFEVEKPGAEVALGFDALPDYVRTSTVLTGNDLGVLGNLKAMPDSAVVLAVHNEFSKELTGHQVEDRRSQRHRIAQQLIQKGRIVDALALCLE